MPMNTRRKPAATIRSSSSGSSARLTDASVMKSICGRRRSRHAISARSNSFTSFLLPMKLSSTKKTVPCQPAAVSASSSAIICSGVLVRGLRPFMTMMSQNSQSNGQPRENWIDIVA